MSQTENTQRCESCGWEGTRKEVDYSFTPLGQDGFRPECNYWRCPDCGEDIDPSGMT